MVRNGLRAAVAALVVSGVSVSPARATPIYYSVINTSAQNVNTATSDSDTAPQTTTDTLGPITSSVTNASSTAFVNDGMLGASATATAGSADTAFNSGLATATFRDTLTLFSNSLADGTTVSLLFTLALTGTTSSTNFLTDGCRAHIDASLIVDPDGLANETQVQGFINSNPCTDPDTTNIDFVVQANIGDEVAVAATLTAFASARFGATATATATNTLRFFANPQGAFSYTTASGNSYLTPPTNPAAVPEPASVLLFGTGIVAAGLRRFRARR